MKKIVKVLTISLFTMVMFFNISLILNKSDSSNISLSALLNNATAQENPPEEEEDYEIKEDYTGGTSSIEAINPTTGQKISAICSWDAYTDCEGTGPIECDPSPKVINCVDGQGNPI